MREKDHHFEKTNGGTTPVGNKLINLPNEPGVYLFKDFNESIIYIGKSKSLKNRIRSYFHKSAKHNLRTRILVSLIHDFSIIVTDSESEALILEDQLIKKHRPRYNIALKDGKSYPYCKLTVGEMFPRLLLVREKIDNESEYFGPYTSVKDAKQVLKTVTTYFLLRTSKMILDGKKKFRPCLNFQMKKCLAPCKGDVTKLEYQKIVRQVRLFLKGHDKELLQELEKRMKIFAEKLEFEKSAFLRDQIKAVQRIFSKQMVLDIKGRDQDVFNLYRESDCTGVQVFFIREGRLLGTDFFFFEESNFASDNNLLGQALHRIYMTEGSIIPSEILLPFDYSDKKLLEKLLIKNSGKKVKVFCPKKGRKKELIKMAYNNAKFNLLEKREQNNKNNDILCKVKSQIKLNRIPKVVEAFDVSHLSGTMTVASMVCWRDNIPSRNDYRKFKIRGSNGNDDFASIKEVLFRRYNKSKEDKFKIPDLILIDGGKGQTNIAAKVLTELGILKKVDLIGLAKGRTERKKFGNTKKFLDFEYVVKPNQKNEIRLRRNSDVLYFLQKIRDESHRFAIDFQRSMKIKTTLSSQIDNIPGIGAKRRKILLKNFGSIKNLKKASFSEILNAPNISEKLAQKIFNYLKKL